MDGLQMGGPTDRWIEKVDEEVGDRKILKEGLDNMFSMR
jgi:hypothetical protein